MLIYIHTYMQLDRKMQEWLRTTAAGPVQGWLLVANRLVKRWQPLHWHGNGSEYQQLERYSTVAANFNHWVGATTAATNRG